MNVSLLVALWLSMLQAVAGSPARRPDAALARPTRVAAESSVRRSDPRSAHVAPRMSRVVTGDVVATGGAPARHPTLSARLGSPPRPVDGLPGLTDAGAQALHASHAVAASGAVLPYFATAPPLQG